MNKRVFFMKTKIILILFLIAFLHSGASFSQKYSEQQIDSLIKKGDSKFRVEGDYRSVLEWNKKFLRISRQQKYKKGEIECLINIGNVLWNTGRNKESIEVFNSIENDEFVLSNDLLLGKVYQELGQSYGNLKLYDLAITNHKKAAAVLEHSKAIDHQLKQTALTYTFGSIAFYYQQNKMMDSSFAYYHKTLKYDPTPLMYLNLAGYHLKKRSPLDSAKVYIDKAKRMLETKEYPAQQKMLYNRVYGMYLHKKGNNKDAELYLKKALGIALKMKRPMAISFCYEDLTTFYEETNNIPLKNHYFSALTRLNDSLESVKVHDRNFAISDILQENENKLKKETNTSKKTLIFALALLLISLIVIFLYSRNKKRLTNKLNELDLKDIENRQLREQLDNSNDEVIVAAKNNDAAFLIKFQEKYADFYTNLTQRHPNLTKSELTLCAYIRLNFSSKEIANYTFVQHKTIQTQKNRLRRKLDISSEVNLYTYFNNGF